MAGKIVTLNSTIAPGGAQLVFPFYTKTLEEILGQLPKDEVYVMPKLENNGKTSIKYKVYGVYPKSFGPDGLVTEFEQYSFEGEVNDPDNTKKLFGFYYKKPELKSGRTNMLNKNNIKNNQKDGVIRTGYIPIHITTKPIARPQNHLHKLEEGIFCLVKQGDSRETRFFPKSSLFIDNDFKHADSNKSIFGHAKRIIEGKDGICDNCDKHFDNNQKDYSIIPHCMCRQCRILKSLRK